MVLLVPAVPASAAIYTATFETINGVFSGATSGDTIAMTGTFGLTRLQDMVFTRGITLDARQAVFTDTLELVNLSGVRVLGGRFDIASRVTRDSAGAVVYGGTNIAFDAPTILGNANESGIIFSGANSIRVTGGNFTGLDIGLNLSGVTNGFLSRNTFLKAASDGIDIGNSHHVSATYNSCSGSAPVPGAHPDCIQLFSTPGRPLQSDNVVSDNIATGATQGFTSFTNGDDTASGIRLSIMRNTVNTSYPQGIACYGCIDSNISYNKVTTLAGSRFKTTINILGGMNNTVTGNTVGDMPAFRSDQSIDEEFDDESMSSSSAASAAGNETRVELPYESGPSTVTEPGTWAMLVAGFGLVGMATRRRGLRIVAA